MKVSLLDCTLRDGGYLNDWRFGASEIPAIVSTLAASGIEILEVGFLKSEPYQVDRTVFSREEQIETLIQPKRPGLEYAAMIEVVNALPLEDLVHRSQSSIDIIRVIVWKRLLKEGIDYCRAIAKKGYKVFVQPARVSQYSQREFAEMVLAFNEVDIAALYVVDSWGTQSRDSVLEYLRTADAHLRAGVALGYHGHNNLQQAFSCAEAFVSASFSRSLVVDGTVFGMGRGAGNLSLEVFAAYMNKTCGKSYSIPSILDVYSRFIEPEFRKTPWGYSTAHLVTALLDCNPEYGTYLGRTKDLGMSQLLQLLSKLSPSDRIIFSQEAADRLLIGVPLWE